MAHDDSAPTPIDASPSSESAFQTIATYPWVTATVDVANRSVAVAVSCRFQNAGLDISKFVQSKLAKGPLPGMIHLALQAYLASAGGAPPLAPLDDAEYAMVKGLILQGIGKHWSREVYGWNVQVTAVERPLGAWMVIARGLAKDLGQGVGRRSFNLATFHDLLPVVNLFLADDFARNPENEKRDLALVGAHELGHTILRKRRGVLFSLTHKGTSDVSQSPSLLAPSYPASGAVDLMMYYKNKPSPLRFDDTKADVADVDALVRIALPNPPWGPIREAATAAFDLPANWGDAFLADQKVPKTLVQVLEGASSTSDSVLPFHTALISSTESSTTGAKRDALLFQVGPPVPPLDYDNIFDHGFLNALDADGEPIADARGHYHIDESKYRVATPKDYAAKLAAMAAAEAYRTVRPDLTLALDTYHHFHTGGGRAVSFDLSPFLKGDPAGRRALDKILIFAGAQAVMLSDGRKGRSGPESPFDDEFDMVSNSVSVGANMHFGYPELENWQKAIGGFQLWASAHVRIGKASSPLYRRVSVQMLVYGEDRYNFNPKQGSSVGGTHVADAENGRFEVTRLAHEFRQRGRAHCDMSFDIGLELLSSAYAPMSLQYSVYP